MWVQDLPAAFQWFGLGQAGGRVAIVAAAVVVFVLFAWGLRQLAAGRSVYATGSDPEAARLAGIHPRAWCSRRSCSWAGSPAWPRC